jgi:sterol 3beta-glucosyltransferase
MADQPWWGKRLQERGLAPRATPVRQLNVDALATSITEAPEYRQAVADTAGQMTTEDGPARALETLSTALTSSC